MKASLKLSLALALVASAVGFETACAKATPALPDPFTDLSTRQPLAAQKFAENGFEIIGHQSSYGNETLVYNDGPFHKDCYTLKSTPDTGERYQGCAVFSKGKVPPELSVTGLSLKP